MNSPGRSGGGGRDAHSNFNVWKYFVIFSGFFIIGMCALVIYHFKDTSESCEHGLDCSEQTMFKNSPSALSQCQETCITKPCIDAASHILQMLDPKKNPCEDFYDFVCGNYPEDSFFAETDIPVRVFRTLRELTTANAKRLLLQNWNDAVSEASESLRKKREKLYHNCIDERISEGDAVSTLLKYISHAGLPNWPLLDESVDFGGVSVEEFIGKFSSVGVTAIANIVFGKSLKSSDVQTVFLRPGDPFLEYCSARKIPKIRKFWENFLTDLGMSRNDSHNLIKTILEIDLHLANRKDSGAVEYTSRRSIDCYGIDLSTENRWCRLVRYHAEESGMPLHNTRLNITLSRRGWFSDIEEILDTYSGRIISHYLAIHFLLEYEEHLGTLFRKEGLTFSSMWCALPDYELPVPAFEDRQKWCINWMGRYVSLMLNSDYIKTHVTEAQINRVKEVLSYIKETEISATRNMTCLPEALSRTIIFNVNYTRMNLNFFYKYEKEKNLSERLYAEFNVTGNNFVENYLAFQKFSVLMDLKHKTRDYVLDSSPKNFYTFGTESGPMVEIRLGSFQSPNFVSGQPRFIDFGKFGFLLGHETAHTILHEMKYLPDPFQPIVNNTQCVTDQYNQYELPYQGVNINGKHTYHENIADYIGMETAQKAYRKYLENHGREPMLPGLNFTNEQLFFISAGQFLCEYGDRKSFEMYVNHNDSPMKYRVHGTLVNVEEFAEAFNCPVGSPMNPAKKCNLRC